jgi:hypothetical protein
MSGSNSSENTPPAYSDNAANSYNTNEPFELELLRQRIDAIDIPTQTDASLSQPEEQIRTQRWEFSVTNERTLRKLGPLVKDTKGAIIAIGTDQGLDLFSAAPLASDLEIVDVEATATIITTSYLESALRFEQMMGRTPSPSEMSALQSNNQLLISLCNLPPAEAIQHTFTPQELAVLGQRYAGPYSELGKHLQDLTIDQTSWIQTVNLTRIINAYRTDHIHARTGSIADYSPGSAMDAIKERRASVGLVYLSNVVNYTYLWDGMSSLANGMEELTNDRPDCIFIHSIADVDMPNVPRERGRGNEDWTYLLQRSVAVFAKHVRPGNPNVTRVSPYIVIRKIPQGHAIQYLGEGIYGEWAPDAPTQA